MRAKAIKNHPVVNLEDGALMGKIQDLLVNPAEKKVEALLVGEKGLLLSRTQYILYDRVYKIGKDVITIEPGKHLVTADQHTHLENLKNYSFLGNSVISQEGDYLAKVKDFTFQTSGGEIEYLILAEFKEELQMHEEMFLHIKGVLNLGRDYVIIRPDYMDYLQAPVSG